MHDWNDVRVIRLPRMADARGIGWSLMPSFLGKRPIEQWLSTGNQSVGIPLYRNALVQSFCNELLDVAMHDLICIMHEVVSGELRIADRRYMHGIPKNLRNVRRGTSNDLSMLHQQAAASSLKAPRKLLPAAVNEMEGESAHIRMCPRASRIPLRSPWPR